ncbi:hypothetical protein CBI38_22850 [Rhodococcus oxybenzonivorans]|uniref:Uncharacterized protein n=1 Tax=Rhodococcus oxybenzonivorans TaxID=1990687 RepID=A0A2S2BZA5_9NOCA|nr:hypothetical protein CBI38_22850 [Rhodococcus oxybenzonivorans]
MRASTTTTPATTELVIHRFRPRRIQPSPSGTASVDTASGDKSLDTPVRWSRRHPRSPLDEGPQPAASLLVRALVEHGTREDAVLVQDGGTLLE